MDFSFKEEKEARSFAKELSLTSRTKDMWFTSYNKSIGEQQAKG